MNIYCGTKPGKAKPEKPVVEAGQMVNKIGNYLYNHIDGAFKFEKKANMYEIYFLVLYEIPKEFLRKYNITDEKYNKLFEMNININVTTYQNKIRVNTISMDPEEETLGFDLFPPEKLVDLNKAYELIMSKVHRRIEKRFSDFDFVF